MDNPFGIKAQFYSMEDKSVVCLFEFKEEHQSYPNRVHGGIITAMLDEIAGRALWAIGETGFGVTTSLQVKFRKPVPYGVKLKGVGKITKISPRFFEAVAEIYHENTLLSSGEIKYLRLANEQICDAEMESEMAYLIKDNITEIE